jgi:hypothetical protein
MGQSRRFGRTDRMSAMTSIATELLHYGSRRLGPRADINDRGLE